MWNPHFSLQFDSGFDLQCGSKINLAGRGKFKKDTICFCWFLPGLICTFNELRALESGICEEKWKMKDEKRGQHPLEKGVYPAWPLVASCHWIPCWLAANFWEINWPLLSATPMLHNALGHILQAALTKRSSHPSHIRMQEAASLSTWGEVALRATAWHMNRSKGWAV